jgi:hypothetical protein
VERLGEVEDQEGLGGLGGEPGRRQRRPEIRRSIVTEHPPFHRLAQSAKVRGLRRHGRVGAIGVEGPVLDERAHADTAQHGSRPLGDESCFSGWIGPHAGVIKGEYG